VALGIFQKDALKYAWWLLGISHEDALKKAWKPLGDS
jgi:hypothetical protein